MGFPGHGTPWVGQETLSASHRRLEEGTFRCECRDGFFEPRRSKKAVIGPNI